MVHTAGLGEPYFVTLVPLNGIGGAWVQPKTRSPKEYFWPPAACPVNPLCNGSQTANYSFPETSISSTHVYFLDGDTEVRSLAPNGTVQTVMSIAAPPNSQVVFAVSPDDSRIAVSVITLAASNTAASFDDRLYVEDLGTASNRADLYSSTTLAEWPIGWHGNDVVAASASDISVNTDSPYGGTAYRLVDSVTGNTTKALECNRGLLVPAGVACATGWCSIPSSCQTGTLGKESWGGQKFEFSLATGRVPRIFPVWTYLDLSPDGTRLLGAVVSDPGTGMLETDLFGDGTSSVVSGLGAPQGWLDDTHVVVSSSSAVWIIDLTSDSATQVTGLKTVALNGMPTLAGVLPGGF